jgi:hypothetical protein
MSHYNPTMPNNRDPKPQNAGPAGGGWIRTDKELRVLERDQSANLKLYGMDDQGYSRFYAVGDCNMVTDIPIPKISYPGEEQAAIACRNIEVTDKIVYEGKTNGCYKIPK